MNQAEQDIQAGSSGSSCRCFCCLAEGKHQLESVYINMFRRCLNLIVDPDPGISSTICSACISFVKEVQRFREMVLASQKELHGSLTFQVPAEDSYQNDTKIIEMVKTEVDTESQDLPVYSEDVLADIVDFKHEISSVKSETDTIPEDHSDWEAFGDIKNYVKSEAEETEISKDECNITKQDNDVSTRKINNEFAVVSYILEIKEGRQPSLAEPKEQTSELPKRRREDFSLFIQQNSTDPTKVEENKISSNIVLILTHSTIMPFKNYLSTFKCFYCAKKYVLFKELREHMTEHVNICEDNIRKILKLSHEIITYADISHIQCKLCDENLESIELLIEHLNKIHGKVIYDAKKLSYGVLGFDMSSERPKCHICDKEFSYFRNLKVHMNEHFGFLVCFVCGKKFMSEKRYEGHISTAHVTESTNGAKCTLCNKILKTKAKLKYHIDKEHRKRDVKCHLCPETFPYGQYMKRLRHMAEVHDIKKPIFKCDTCGKEYQTSTSLNAHKRLIHIKPKEYICDICGYVTTDGCYMPKHLNMHKGVKKYECRVCDKKLATSTSLRLHMRMHSNDKRFACPMCDAAFIQKHCLKSHLKAKHPDADLDLILSKS